MSADLEVYQPQQPATQAVALLEIDSWTAVASQVIRLAKEIYDTPFVPDGLRGSVPAVAAAILAGRELGLPPMTSLANVHVIKGKPALAAVLMRALIQAQGHQWQDVDVTDTRVVIRARRKGESEWTTVTFTADQMRHAKVDIGGWPQDKLYARATSRMARRKFADVIAGMPYSAEELEDGAADEGTITDDVPAAIDPPKPAAARTARRRTTPAAAVPDEKPASGPAAAAGASPAQPDSGLPPLPGEEDPADVGATAPGSNEPAGSVGQPERGKPDDERHRKLVGIVQQHFKRLGFADDDRDDRLWAASKIAAVKDIASLNDLDPAELSTVADTLATCRDRKRLEEVLAAAGEGAGDG
jgi:hypothetical protein